MKLRCKNLNLITLLVIIIAICLLQFVVPNVCGATTFLEEDESNMLYLLNRERDAHDLPPLQHHSVMKEMAREHCEEMVEEDYFAHVSPISGELLDRMEKSGIANWVTGGENIAGAPNINTAFEALMDSPEHKKNILSKEFTHIGIGIVEGGSYGLMITQDFVELDAQGEMIAGVKAVSLGKKTRITFEVSEPCYVTAGIYNDQGGLVKELVDSESKDVGVNSIQWDGKVKSGFINRSNGKYEYRIEARDLNGDKVESLTGIVSGDGSGESSEGGGFLFSLFSMIQDFFNDLLA